LDIKQNYRIFESATYIQDSIELQGVVASQEVFENIICTVLVPHAQDPRIQPHKNCQTWTFEALSKLKEGECLD
jgi:hypothetical protein